MTSPLLVKKRGRGDPYYLPSGNPSKGITQEISMNKQTGEELKHSNEVSEIILDSMSDAVSLINTDDYSIIDANKAFWGQYGLSKKDILGKPCYLVTHNRKEPCCPPNDICPLIETVRENRTAHAEHIHFFPDGSKNFAEITTSEEEREKLIIELQTALSEIKTLRGLLPICMNCHKIRTEHGAWNKLETYISKHSDAEFSHGICPDCFDKQMKEIE
jgi:PAS domain-containing protein